MDISAPPLLLSHDWPGNVRELEHQVTTLDRLCSGDVITERSILGSGEQLAMARYG